MTHKSHCNRAVVPSADAEERQLPATGPKVPCERAGEVTRIRSWQIRGRNVAFIKKITGGDGLARGLSHSWNSAQNSPDRTFTFLKSLYFYPLRSTVNYVPEVTGLVLSLHFILFYYFPPLAAVNFFTIDIHLSVYVSFQSAFHMLIEIYVFLQKKKIHDNTVCVLNLHRYFVL